MGGRDVAEGVGAIVCGGDDFGAVGVGAAGIPSSSLKYSTALSVPKHSKSRFRVLASSCACRSVRHGTIHCAILVPDISAREFAWPYQQEWAEGQFQPIAQHRAFGTTHPNVNYSNQLEGHTDRKLVIPDS